MARREAKFAGSEAEKHYIANFCLIEAYWCFTKYWQKYAYIDVIEQIEANSQTFNASKLRVEFLEEGDEIEIKAAT